MRTSQDPQPAWARWIYLAIAVGFCALVAYVAFRVIGRLL